MKPRLLLSVIAAIALVVAGAAVIVLTANQPPRAQETYYPRPTRDPDEPPECQNAIEVGFRTDAAMYQAASRFENDSRFYSPVFATQAQNLERIKRVFQGQPEVLKLVKPESVPASITVSLSYSGSKRSLIEELANEYGSATVTDPCEVPASTTRPVPTTRTTR